MTFIANLCGTIACTLLLFAVINAVLGVLPPRSKAKTGGKVKHPIYAKGDTVWYSTPYLPSVAEAGVVQDVADDRYIVSSSLLVYNVAFEEADALLTERTT